jgi:hypothetical protein
VLLPKAGNLPSLRMLVAKKVHDVVTQPVCNLRMRKEFSVNVMKTTSAFVGTLLTVSNSP